VEATEKRLCGAVGWLGDKLTLRQLSDARLIEKGYWVRYGGASYPNLSPGSIFMSRPWDDGKRTPAQKKALVSETRRKIL